MHTIDTTSVSPGRLPEFLIIGAMKAGSTTLWAHLNRHPDLFMCRPKEPQFFSRDKVFERGLDWYRGLFTDAKPEQLCGEASVCYTRYPAFGAVEQRVFEYLPEAKLIFIARDPVARAISHYRHNQHRRVARGKSELNLDDAVEADPSILSAGRYCEQLNRYLDLYPRERLCCVTFEQLVTERSAVLGSVAEFLEIDPARWTCDQEIVANAAGDSLSRYRVARSIYRLRRSPVHAVTGLVPRPIRTKFRSWLLHPKFTNLLGSREIRALRDRLAETIEAVRPMLADYYREPNAAFRDFLKTERLGWSDDPVDGESAAQERLS